MRFVMFVVDSDTRTGSPAEMAAINIFNEKLRSNGHWVMAFGLEKPGSGSIQNADDFYSGIWIIEARDQDEAQDLAKEAQSACNRRVELRAFL